MPEEQEEIRVKPNVVVEEEPKVEEGISCKLESFEPKICGPEPTLILFLGKKTENPDAVTQALFDRQDDMSVNVGVLDLADDNCQELSEKYKIDRDESQALIFQNCEKKGGVALSAENAPEQIDKLKEIIEQLK